MTWINVKDRLPDINVDVLTIKASGKMNVDYRCYEEREEIAANSIFFRESKVHGGLVTHWMPLPEPPGTQMDEWIIKCAENEMVLVKADKWECGGNGLQFYIGDEVIAWFLVWERFMKRPKPEGHTRPHTAPNSAHEW